MLKYFFKKSKVGIYYNGYEYLLINPDHNIKLQKEYTSNLTALESIPSITAENKRIFLKNFQAQALVCVNSCDTQSEKEVLIKSMNKHFKDTFLVETEMCLALGANLKPESCNKKIAIFVFDNYVLFCLVFGAQLLTKSYSFYNRKTDIDNLFESGIYQVISNTSNSLPASFNSINPTLLSECQVGWANEIENNIHVFYIKKSFSIKERYLDYSIKQYNDTFSYIENGLKTIIPQFSLLKAILSVPKNG
jgi:hypothetical protein